MGGRGWVGQGGGREWNSCMDVAAEETGKLKLHCRCSVLSVQVLDI